MLVVEDKIKKNPPQKKESFPFSMTTLASLSIQLFHFAYLATIFTHSLTFGPANIYALLIGIAWLFEFRVDGDEDTELFLHTYSFLVVVASVLLGWAVTYFLGHPRLIKLESHRTSATGKRIWHPWVSLFVVGVWFLVAGVYLTSRTDIADLTGPGNYWKNVVLFSVLFFLAAVLLVLSVWAMYRSAHGPKHGRTNLKYLLALVVMASTPAVYDLSFSSANPPWVPWNGLVHLVVQVAAWILFAFYALLAWRSMDMEWDTTVTTLGNARASRIIYFATVAGSIDVFVYAAGWIADWKSAEPADDPDGGDFGTVLVVVGSLSFGIMMFLLVIGIFSASDALSQRLVSGEGSAVRHSYRPGEPRGRGYPPRGPVFVPAPVAAGNPAAADSASAPPTPTPTPTPPPNHGVRRNIPPGAMRPGRGHPTPPPGHHHQYANHYQ